jgi:hypothetical protein
LLPQAIKYSLETNKNTENLSKEIQVIKEHCYSLDVETWLMFVNVWSLK